MTLSKTTIAIIVTVFLLALFIGYSIGNRSSSSSRKEIENKLKESEKEKQKARDSVVMFEGWNKNLVAKVGVLEDAVETSKGKIGKTITVIRYIHASPHTITQQDSILRKRYAY